jgi:hypothetical protein
LVAGGDLLAGEPRRAAGSFEQALGKVHDIGDRVGEACVLCGLGAAKTRLAELGETRAPLQRAGTRGRLPASGWPRRGHCSG